MQRSGIQTSQLASQRLILVILSDISSIFKMVIEGGLSKGGHYLEGELIYLSYMQVELRIFFRHGLTQ